MKHQVLDGLAFLKAVPVIYVDFPLHYNVGDQLINQGTEAAFAALELNVIARLSLLQLGHIGPDGESFVPNRHIAMLDRMMAEGATLVMHGGGNFGDIYRDHQAFREFLIQRYPGKPIVVLPQSVHFDTEQSKARAVRVMRGHGAIRMFLRDHESLRFARDECGVEASALPDMAQCLWQTPEFTKPLTGKGKGELVFARRDGEEAGWVRANATECDWDDLITGTDNALRKLYRLREKAAITEGLALSSWRHWYHLRNRVTFRTANFFAQYDSVITDRLHGMILSTLLYRPLSFVDNRYGKLSRYYQAWLSGSDQVAPRVESPHAPKD